LKSSRAIKSTGEPVLFLKIDPASPFSTPFLGEDEFGRMHIATGSKVKRGNYFEFQLRKQKPLKADDAVL
jgi:hypothetical protein